MIRPPSNQTNYDEFWTGDPAFIQLGKDATEAEQKAHREKFRVARETGDWTPLLVGDDQPTKFVMGQIDRDIWRSILDRIAISPDNSKWIGPTMMPALLFRLALRSVANFDGLDATRQLDKKWGWNMAPVSIVQQLDEIDPAIVGEIGSRIFDRLMNVLSPKR